MVDLIPLPQIPSLRKGQPILPLGLDVDLDFSLKNFWKPFFEKKSIVFAVQVIDEFVLSRCEKCRESESSPTCPECFDFLDEMFSTLKPDLRMVFFTEINLNNSLVTKKKKERNLIVSNCAVSIFSSPESRTHLSLFGNIEFLSSGGKKVLYNLLEKKKFTRYFRHPNGILMYFQNCSEMNERIRMDKNYRDILLAFKFFYFCSRLYLMDHLKGYGERRVRFKDIIEKDIKNETIEKSMKHPLTVLLLKLEKVYSSDRNIEISTLNFIPFFEEFLNKIYSQ